MKETMAYAPSAAKGERDAISFWGELYGYKHLGYSLKNSVKRTFERSYTHVAYGSSAKACCIVSMAPSMSSSLIKETSNGIVQLGQLCNDFVS
jgi:hypothetical protein